MNNADISGSNSGDSGVAGPDIASGKGGGATANSAGIRVFVYGSLKAGHGNHALLEGATFLGRQSLSGRYAMLDIGYYPGVVEVADGPRRTIYGEVYRIDKPTLESLDLLEGHPNYYRRTKVGTDWKGAWCYFLPVEHMAHHGIIEAGTWVPSDEEKEWIESQLSREE